METSLTWLFGLTLREAHKKVRALEKERLAAAKEQGTDAPLMPDEWFDRREHTHDGVDETRAQQQQRKETIWRLINGWNAQQSWEEREQREREANWLLTRLSLEDALLEAEVMWSNWCRAHCEKPSRDFYPDREENLEEIEDLEKLVRLEANRRKEREEEER